ncbi:hypothetical protein ABZX40_28375 [Streptomyces sp. NPDC004610]|uniref:hypothetical protein n=1 Tax=unclassified Streptomyces TaxID=2593676 RepID=UPI0033A7ABC9
MASRIRILQAISGPDFSWAPGDLVTLPDDEAAVWADGERAAPADGTETPAAVPGPSAATPTHALPVVTGEDGEVLDVVAASIEPTSPPEGQDPAGGWVRWSVTVRVPVPEPGPDLFDPAGQSVKDVLAYLDGVGEQEAIRVLTAEENAETPRKGITGQRGSILERARSNDEAGAERAARLSSGGGSDTIETR